MTALDFIGTIPATAYGNPDKMVDEMIRIMEAYAHQEKKEEVDKALQAASENAEIEGATHDFEGRCIAFINKDSILNAYKVEEL